MVIFMKSVIEQIKKQFDNAEKVLTDFELKVNQQRNSRAARIGSVLEAIHRYQQDLQEQNNFKTMQNIEMLY